MYIGTANNKHRGESTLKINAPAELPIIFEKYEIRRQPPLPRSLLYA
jgi:hypothetical protein